MEWGGVTLGLREGVIALIALVAIYIVFVLLRMTRLRHGQAAATPARPEAAPPVLNEPHGEAGTDTADAAAWESARSGLADDMLNQGLAQEIAQLRDEVEVMRGELAALRADMQQELAHLRAGQTMSPIYGDAMQMAVAGYDPATIAERCGIARAEAELVVALAKSQER